MLDFASVTLTKWTLSIVAIAALSNSFDEFEVGDLVRVEFMGKTFETEVLEVNRNGWVKVEVEFMDRKRVRTFPPSQVEKLSDATTENPFDPDGPTHEFRTWNDSTGKFRVEARLLEYGDKTIKIEKKDGRVVELPIAKLSQADQTYVDRLKNQANAEDDPENPFAGGTKLNDGMAESDDDSDASAGFGDRRNRRNRIGRSKRGDWKTNSPQLESINTFTNQLVLVANRWNVEPDGQTRKDSVDVKQVAFPATRSEHAFHANERFLISNSNLPFCALSRSNPFDEASELYVVRMSDSKLIADVIIPEKKTNLLAVSPNGNSVVTLSDASARSRDRLSLWTVDGRTFKNTQSWDAEGLFSSTHFNPAQAFFVDDKRLLLLGKQVVLLDCESGKTLYSFARKNGQVAISSGQQQIAVVAHRSIFVIESDGGDSLGQLDEPDVGVDALSFSSDGSLLAGINNKSGRIWVWDMQAGELKAEMAVSPDGRGESLEWLDNQFLLVDNKHVVDTELRSKVWQFSAGRGGVHKSHGKFWKMESGRLSPINAGPINLAEKTAGFDPEELLVLAPGTKVEIEVAGKLPFDRNVVTEIRDAMTRELEDNEIDVVDNADVKLRLSVIKGQKETSEFRSWFASPFSRKGEKATYTPNICKVELVKGDRAFWSTTRTFSAGHVIHLKENESIQAAARRVCKPNSSFFTQTQLPKYFAELKDGKLMGESRL